MVASLAVGGVLLLAMVAASARAAVTLGPEARIPLHFGSERRCYWASKRAGLVIWPAAGAVACGVCGGVAASSLAADWVPGVRDVLTPAVLCVLLGFQAGALVLAGQHQRPGNAAAAGDAEAEREPPRRSRGGAAFRGPRRAAAGSGGQRRAAAGSA